ncbi:MAG: DUF4430 domain-containing protein [Clostridiales bacterium]|nr:DUF4430 domain-containing protein [Clostridiales bacterium]
MWWKKNKWKVIVPVLIVAVLAVAFWYGGGAPGMQGWSVKDNTVLSDNRVQEPATTPDISKDTPVKPSESIAPSDDDNEPQATANAEEAEPSVTSEPIDKPADAEPSERPTGIENRPGGTEGGMSVQEKLDVAAELAGESSPGVETGDQAYSEEQGMVIDPNTGKDKYMTDPVPEGKPVPVEPQNVTISDEVHTCTLSVRCDTILDNIDWLDPEKVELVPEDGVIFAAAEVSFYEGESVFNVLQREMKRAKIHMEFSNTPMYNSAYIEGINNLYEFDCGELSGWMYKVNGWFPNYGCSRYQLKEGDVIEWVYTCNLGVDVGGFYAAGG